MALVQGIALPNAGILRNSLNAQRKKRASVAINRSFLKVGKPVCALIAATGGRHAAGKSHANSAAQNATQGRLNVVVFAL